jgi:hypothetical protein
VGGSTGREVIASGAERRPPLMTETEGTGGAGGLRPEWLLERDGTRYVRYAGLLALAHARGLRRITTEPVKGFETRSARNY